MTPRQVLAHLESILGSLDHLAPYFSTLDDRANLVEARAALEDLAGRLEQEIGEAC